MADAEDLALELALSAGEHDVILAGGQGKLQGKIFRIGHLGLVEEKDIRETLQSLEQALPKLGYKPAAVRPSS